MKHNEFDKLVGNIDKLIEIVKLVDKENEELKYIMKRLYEHSYEREKKRKHRGHNE